MSRFVHVWYEVDNGWIERHHGRFTMRRHPEHISRVVDIIRRRIERESGFRVDANMKELMQ